MYLDYIRLPDLVIDNEFGKENVHAETERSLDGRPIIWDQEIPTGKPFDLVGGDNFGWITRDNLINLQALAATPNAVYYLWYNQRKFLVRFRNEDTPVISASPLVPRWNHEVTDYYNNVRIKLMEV